MWRPWHLAPVCALVLLWGVAGVGGGLPSASASPSCIAGVAGTTSVFEGGGEHCYTIPAGVTTVHVVATGAAGGSTSNASASASGGLGAIVSADVLLPDGISTLYVEVGGIGGFGNTPTDGTDGGGPGGSDSEDDGGAGGGGASDVRTCSTAAVSCPTDPRLVVAGGGGGAGSPGDSTDGQGEGAGGNAGFTGDAGIEGSQSDVPGGGGAGQGSPARRAMTPRGAAIRAPAAAPAQRRPGSASAAPVV